MKRFILLFFFILLAGCVSPATEAVSDAEQARTALVNFFSALNSKRYEEAVALYGGDYEQLQIFNPEIDPANHPALWTWVCDQQLLRCLQVRSATLTHQESNTYVFQVEFNNPDGSLFVLGPCCGANETDMPPVSKFEYTVIKNPEGKFVIMNLPPYVP